MGKPKNVKKGSAEASGPGTRGKARKGLEKVKEEAKRKIHFSQTTLFKRDVKKAQKNSAKSLPFQKAPIMRKFRAKLNEVADPGQVMRMSGAAQSRVMEGVDSVIYDSLFGAYNISVIGRKKQTLQVRDLMLTWTNHPNYSRMIGIDPRSYNQAHSTGAHSLITKRRWYFPSGTSGEGEGVMKVRSGKAGASKSKKKKEVGLDTPSTKKTSRKKNAKADADPEATIDTSEAADAAKADNDAASVEEEDGDAHMEDEEIA